MRTQIVARRIENKPEMRNKSITYELSCRLDLRIEDRSARISGISFVLCRHPLPTNACLNLNDWSGDKSHSQKWWKDVVLMRRIEFGFVVISTSLGRAGQNEARGLSHQREGFLSETFR